MKLEVYSLILFASMSPINGKRSLKKGKDWVTIVTVSEWYDDMFQNWLNWYEKLELDMKVILIAEDQFIHNKYLNHTSSKVVCYHHGKDGNMSGSNMNHNGEGFKKISFKKTRLFAKDIEEISKNYFH